MFERIVVGTDGSDTASEAVRQAIELAQAARRGKLRRGGRLRAGSQSRLREEKGEVPGDVAVRGRSARGRQRDPRRRRRHGQAAGHRGEPYPREGDPADAILDVAEEVGADLIVVGNKGMTARSGSCSAACRTRSPTTRPAASTSSARPSRPPGRARSAGVGRGRPGRVQQAGAVVRWVARERGAALEPVADLGRRQARALGRAAGPRRR